MTKYSFIVLSNEVDSFLLSLQDLGMVDITRSKRAIDDYSREQLSVSGRYKKAISKLNSITKEKSEIEPIYNEIPNDLLLETVERVLSLKDELKMSKIQSERELQEALNWGDYSKEDLVRINALGYDLKFYSTSEKKFKEEWENQYPMQVLNRVEGKVYFTILVPKGEEFSFNLMESKFPENPISYLQQEIKKLEESVLLNEREIQGLPKHIETLEGMMNDCNEALDLYFTNAAIKKEGEESISVMVGFAPEDDQEKISSFLDSTSAYYFKEEAVIDDNPPVELKNNKFAKLFEPIAGLYTLPLYNELDLTPYFAPFYMLFFGLCLGDIGYGLVLMIIGAIVNWKMPKFASYGKLIILLGLGSVIMPMLSGSFFGLKIYEIFPMSEKIQGMFFTDLNFFWFSIIFGIFQIIVARIISAVVSLKKRDWDAGLANIGWCLVIVWLTFAYAGSQIGSEIIPSMVNNSFAIVGLILILFCSKPSKHFFLRPFKGLISLYDITGIFGDILSYIRLFGLGMTGGILALVINSIAAQFTGSIVGWVIAIPFLIVGHLAVLGLSCLGAFVHPIRLTFVEFYKNVGFEGGGRAFNPLKKQTNKQ